MTRAGAWCSSGGGSSPRSAATMPAKITTSAVAAGVDDARVAQHGEQVRRAHHRSLAGRDRALEHGRDHVVLLSGVASGPRRVSGMCASSTITRWAISRTTVRIVPSAGSRTDA